MLADDLIRGAQAASEFLGGAISTQQVYKLTRSGGLPFIKKGRALYYRKSELEAAFRSEPPAGREAA